MSRVVTKTSGVVIRCRTEVATLLLRSVQSRRGLRLISPAARARLYAKAEARSQSVCHSLIHLGAA